MPLAHPWALRLNVRGELYSVRPLTVGDMAKLMHYAKLHEKEFVKIIMDFFEVKPDLMKLNLLQIRLIMATILSYSDDHIARNFPNRSRRRGGDDRQEKFDLFTTVLSVLRICPGMMPVDVLRMRFDLAYGLVDAANRAKEDAMKKFESSRATGFGTGTMTTTINSMEGLKAFFSNGRIGFGPGGKVL